VYAKPSFFDEQDITMTSTKEDAYGDKKMDTKHWNAICSFPLKRVILNLGNEDEP
jgi:hypothetical protein